MQASASATGGPAGCGHPPLPREGVTVVQQEVPAVHADVAAQAQVGGAVALLAWHPEAQGQRVAAGGLQGTAKVRVTLLTCWAVACFRRAGLMHASTKNHRVQPLPALPAQSYPGAGLSWEGAGARQGLGGGVDGG